MLKHRTLLQGVATAGVGGVGSYAGPIERMMWDMVHKVPAWRA